MSIRKTLLVAFLSVGLVCAILLASLAFVKAREALQAQIESTLSAETAGIGANIDKMMFERLQNAVVWSRLDIMQDLQVHDVDKRLSRFLSDLKAGYRDVYVNLSCVDRADRIIASSDAALVGTTNEKRAPWLSTTLSGTQLAFELGGNASDTDVVIDVAIPSAFGQEPIGSLRLQLDWSEIDTMLDRSSIGGNRLVAVLDGDGVLIGASSELRRRILLRTRALADWRQIGEAAVARNGAPLVDAPVIVGGARSHGYADFAGFGWTTLIVQPVEQAFAPIHRMGMIFVGLLGLIIAFTVLVAFWVSDLIARPITALTGLARGYMRRRVLQAPAARGTGEVGELSDAFVQMIDDIDRSQQNLVRASKLAVVGELSSIIAHEVRTPLGILRSSAQMLRREALISDEGRELVGFIESETERLNRLVAAMLDTARPRDPVFAAVDMHTLIRRTVAMLSAQTESRRISVVLHLRADDAVVACDEEQMTQVVLNLLVNGLQILQPGGRVEVTTSGDEMALTIDIADDGPGIAPAERNRVFEAFFFRREGGVGLGLAIVQQIVSAHDGEIVAGESALGGALFRIRLPRHRTS